MALTDSDSVIERVIAKRLVTDLIRAGYTLSVNDGEETTLARSTDRRAVFAALATTGEDYLYAHTDPDSVFGWVRLIWGNGPDLISDYSVNLDGDLAGANALADRFDR